MQRKSGETKNHNCKILILAQKKNHVILSTNYKFYSFKKLLAESFLVTLCYIQLWYMTGFSFGVYLVVN